jgi:hypothetical protein
MNSGPGSEEEDVPSGRDTADGDGASLMAALFNRRRQWIPLSSDQIKIVDEFVAGRLAGEAASAAERLVRENAFAAERVMERRLVQQAKSGPAPPRALTESILRDGERATARRSPIKRPFGAALLSWKIAGIAVVSVAAMVLGGELLLNAARSPNGIGQDAKQANNNPTDAPPPERSATVPAVQVAMATIANRDLLTEPSDVKLRSEPGRSSSNNADPRRAPGTSESVVPRFYDIEVPSDLLAGWMARARSGSQIPSTELAPLVGSLQTFDSLQNMAILFDEALQARIGQGAPPGIAKQASATRLRVYDLRQQPADDLLKAISIKTAQKLAPRYFVTLRP